MTDTHVWITGAYFPLDGDEENPEAWVSFSYGPFPNQESAEEVADDEKGMIKAIGAELTKCFDIDCIDLLSYSQACKHFEETLMSDHFSELLPIKAG